jgi:phage/plasmid-associated DNA primase
MNSQLKSGDTSDGLTRRLVIVDFLVSFVDYPDPSNPYERRKNVDILDNIITELQSGGIFNWVYEGYKLLSKVGYFTETNDQEQLLKEFTRASNPVLQFWEESEILPAEYKYQQAYEDYKMWCVGNGYHAESSLRFHTEYKKITRDYYEPTVKSVRVDGKPRKERYYVVRQDYKNPT